MRIADIFDTRELKKLCDEHPASEIAKEVGVDARVVHRAMRIAGIPTTPEPVESVRMRIKDTERGRKLAEALGLEVNVIYPEDKDVH